MANISPNPTGFEIYKRLLSFVVPYWRMFLLAIFGMVLFSIAELLSVWIIDPLLDGGFIKKDLEVIQWLPFAIIGIFTVRMFGSFFTDYGMAWVSRHVIFDLRQKMFMQFLQLPLGFYNKNSSGSVQSKMIYDVEQLADASSSALTILIRDTITIIFFMAYMLYISWQLTTILIVIIPLIVVIVMYVSKKFRSASQKIQKLMGDVSAISDEAISANKEIKIFDGIDYEYDKFTHINMQNKRQFLRYYAINAFSTPLIQLIAAFALAAIVYFSTNNIFVPEISATGFATYILAMMRMMMNAKRLTSVNAVLQRGIAAATSIFEFIDMQPEIDKGKFECDKVKGQVDFKATSFRYENQHTDALVNINLSIKAGESIALVGKSGAGKTSLVNLLPRFFDLSAGDISIDGISINEYKLKNLRSHIAIVSQNVTLFNDTVAHNIAYGSLKSATEEQILSAAKAAHAYEFIEKMPDGLSTMIGEDGVMLSGGQRQRVAIARAILKDAPILILDEATSALDSESEMHIQIALDNLMKNRTTFVIAHRLSTIKNVDRIIVMGDGKVLEEGTHDELMRSASCYSELYNLQFKLSDK